jgi:hypothetical protein
MIPQISSHKHHPTSSGPWYTFHRSKLDGGPQAAGNKEQAPQLFLLHQAAEIEAIWDRCAAKFATSLRHNADCQSNNTGDPASAGDAVSWCLLKRREDATYVKCLETEKPRQ